MASWWEAGVPTAVGHHVAQNIAVLRHHSRANDVRKVRCVVALCKRRRVRGRPLVAMSCLLATTETFSGGPSERVSNLGVASSPDPG